MSYRFISLFLTSAWALFTSQAATVTHDGPEEESVYATFTAHWTGQQYDTEIWQDNWSRTTPQPYGYHSVHYKKPWSDILGYSTLIDTDFYSQGGYQPSQCTTQTIQTDVWVSYNCPCSQLNAPLTWPGNDIGESGYILNYTGATFSGGTKDGLMNEAKRFRIGSSVPTDQFNVKFQVLVWDYNPSTGAETVINPATTAIYVNNQQVDANGYKTFMYVGDNAWHTLTVACAGHPNISYTILFVSATGT